MKPKCLTHYRAVFSGQYKENGKPVTKIIDSQDKDEVYYLFHVFLCNRYVKIYACFHDGTERRIKTRRVFNWMFP